MILDSGDYLPVSTKYLFTSKYLLQGKWHSLGSSNCLRVTVKKLSVTGPAR